MPICSNCPFGFEDGRIVSYLARASRLQVEYEFWNEQRRRLIFEGFVGLRDNCAIGVTVGALVSKDRSDFIEALSRRLYVDVPQDVHWSHFQFLDLDDEPMFEVVSVSCTCAEVDPGCQSSV